jgi:hypothetical protein
VRHAARILKQRLLEVAVAPRAKTQLAEYPPAFPGLQPEDLDVRDGVIFEKANPENRMGIADFIGPSGAQGPLTGTAGEPFFTSTEEGLAYPLRGTPPLFEAGWHLQRGCYLGVRVRFAARPTSWRWRSTRDRGVDIQKVVTVTWARSSTGMAVRARPTAAPSWASAGA